ncbi:hypothetical protein [Streptomyces albidoflavus]|uniref:hypothetical protein n=1 Tax=Streptomyces albidoflavus TaxID=1886 RepID=UPI003D09B759
MFRAKAVLADWDAHIDTHGSLTPGEARRDANIDNLRRQLAAAKREITELNRQLTAAATVIASLHHDNQMLRSEHHAERHPRPVPPPLVPALNQSCRDPFAWGPCLPS